jgi:putative ABC transport system permease protein
LGAEVGSIVTIEVLEGQRPIADVAVVGIAATFIGTAAYMDLGAVRRLMREGDVASGAYLMMDPAYIGEAYARLKETPGVSAVVVKRAALDSFSETLASNILRMRLFNMTFACIIAVGVVYNSARIALAERAHELATLRVLGLYRSEIAAIFLGELAFIALIALPLGLLLGYAFCVFATAMMATDTHRIPLVVSPRTLAFAVAVVLAAAGVTAWEVRRKLDDLDLLSVLKGAS